MGVGSFLFSVSSGVKSSHLQFLRKNLFHPSLQIYWHKVDQSILLWFFPFSLFMFFYLYYLILYVGLVL